MRGCHRKLWENVMEVKLKIEKTNTMTNTWERQRQRQIKTRMSENVHFPYVSTILSVSSEMVQICISSFKRTTLWNCPYGQYSPPEASVRAKVKISNVSFLMID